MIRIAEKSQASLRISVHRDVSRRPKTRVFTPKWWFGEGNPLISGKSRLVKYCNFQVTPEVSTPTGLVTLENQLKPRWMVETKKRKTVIGHF